MDDFLEYTNNLITKAENIRQYDRVHLVLGNESCDLDSTISSITLAYLLYTYRYYKNVEVFPILNVVTEEFPLRTENVFVLNKIGVKLDRLVYRDTIAWEDLANSNTSITATLVDHHVLSPNDSFLSAYVVDIFDHRPLDKSAKWSTNVSLNIEPVGSCCSLIANYYQRFTKDVPPKIAIILHDTIIFDTVALREDVGKAKQLDHEMIDYLKKCIPQSNLKSPLNLFDQLWRAHNDVCTLTGYEIMLKDLKVLGAIFIPGLPMLVKEFLKRNDFEESIEVFYRNKKAKIILLMGLQYEGEVKKDLAIYSLSENGDILKNLIRKLKESSLNLEEDKVDNPHVVYFKQFNIKLSRKQVIPIIKMIEQ